MMATNEQFNYHATCTVLGPVAKRLNGATHKQSLTIRSLEVNLQRDLVEKRNFNIIARKNILSYTLMG